MEKRIGIFIILLLMILQGGCITTSNISDKVNETVERSEAVKIDLKEIIIQDGEYKLNFNNAPMVDINLDFGYVKIDDVNAKSISEIKLDDEIKEAAQNIKVAESEDYILLGYTIGETLCLSSSFDGSIDTTVIVKLNRTGKPLWEKKYFYLCKAGRLSNLLTTPDDGFVFSIQNQSYNNAEVVTKSSHSLIVKCDTDGNEVWNTQIEDSNGTALEKLYLSEKNEIYALGTDMIQIAGPSENEKSENRSHSDIIITKLDSDGKIIKQKKYGGSDFEHLFDSKYDSRMGFVIQGRTQSSDGDFSAKNNQDPHNFIACIDENLTLNWVYSFNEKEGNMSVVNICGEQIFISFYAYNNYGEIIAPTLLSLNKNGELIWRKNDIIIETPIQAMSITKNEELIVGAKDCLILMDLNGKVIKKKQDLNFTANEIIPTADGGIIIKADRQVETIPQPAFVSSIWYDTEAFLAKFDKDLNLIWNKSYNKYEKSVRREFVYILKNEEILVEK